MKGTRHHRLTKAKEITLINQMNGLVKIVQTIPLMRAASSRNSRKFASAKSLNTQEKADALDRLGSRFGGVGWSEVRINSTY